MTVKQRTRRLTAGLIIGLGLMAVPTVGLATSEPPPVAELSASCQAPDSADAAGTTISFNPDNLLDGDPSTVWRCEGGEDQSVTFTLGGEVHLTSLGLINGYVKTDPVTGVDRYPQNARIELARWTFSDGTSVYQDLADNIRTMQSIDVDVTTNTVMLEVVTTYPPGGEAPRDFVPVAEVELVAAGAGAPAPTTTTTEPAPVASTTTPTTSTTSTTTTTTTSTTTPTTSVPVPSAYDIGGVFAYCTRDQAVADFLVNVETVLGAGASDWVIDYAATEGRTLDQQIAALFAEMYVPAEQTLTIPYAWQQSEYSDDDEVTWLGLLFGTVSDCVLDGLDTPERVLNRIQSTRALDGMQDDSWGPYSAQWTYHPDNGLNITIWVA